MALKGGDPIAALATIENQIATLLETAGRAFEQLSQADNPANAESFSRLASQYMQSLKEIHASLRELILAHADIRPFEVSSYGSRKDFELSAAKCQLVSSRLSAAVARLNNVS
mmetsp:Transcript_25158/g.41396  ORF Transcript_25158/g.41396 Transcript_25158/m.41396 type:complete len:113 (-) Transcript_25158:400-738(-)